MVTSSRFWFFFSTDQTKLYIKRDFAEVGDWWCIVNQWHADYSRWQPGVEWALLSRFRGGGVYRPYPYVNTARRLRSACLHKLYSTLMLRTHSRGSIQHTRFHLCYDSVLRNNTGIDFEIKIQLGLGQNTYTFKLQKLLLEYKI